MIDKKASLPFSIARVVCDRQTERPFTGEYNDSDLVGTYLCRQCGLALFYSTTKFDAGCGWPSFDEEIPGAVQVEKDPDGMRTEILCARCHAHLGHVFKGEGLTIKNTRHCVNSVSLDFIEQRNVKDTEEAIVAGGCFWGVEYYLKKLNGVLKVESGYTGGTLENPSYEAVCRSNTGHVEAVRVLFDPTVIDYKTVIRYFFEIHDPTEEGRQGPDIGPQYQSAIFYYNERQKSTVEALIAQLKADGYAIKTKVLPVSVFFRAEEYHQAYYQKNGKTPYCHRYEKRFKD